MFELLMALRDQTGNSLDYLIDVGRLRVAFVPVWNINPYHSELQNGLASAGVDIWTVQSLKEAFEGVTAEKQRMDVLHLQALPYFGWAPNALGRHLMFFWRLTRILRRNIPIVWTVHEIDNHDSAHRQIESLFMRFLSKRVDAMIVHGGEARRLVAAKFNVVESRIHVIPHGNYIKSYENKISMEAARNSLGLDSNHLVLLFFGHLRPYKGILEMVAAFRRIDNSTMRLVIAGLPIDNMEAEIASATRGDSRIKFLPGRVKESEVQVFMNACDVMILPYKRILTSGAAVLAMSFGKACVAPRAGCVTDMLDGSGAIFFDPLRDADLDRALRETVVSRQKLGVMGLHNLNKAKEWDWARIGEQTAAIYRQRIAARKK